MDKKKDHKQDEYDFYREVMKKKPLDKRKIAISMAGVMCSSVKAVPSDAQTYFIPDE